jgi:hypothetical protein
MKRLALVGLTTTMIMGLVGLTGMAKPQDAGQGSNEERGRVCDAGTLKGDYGMSLSGTRPGVGGAPEQFVGISMQTYDGHGNFTQTDNNHGPSGTATDLPGWGTYTVNPDCTGTKTLWVQGLPFPIENRLVVVDKGDELRLAVMAPAPIIVAGVGRRVR